MLLCRQEVIDAVLRLGKGFYGGVQAQIASELRVHRSTVSRDIKPLLTSAAASKPCPVCGTLLVYGRDRDPWPVRAESGSVENAVSAHSAPIAVSPCSHSVVARRQSTGQTRARIDNPKAVL